jgi:hypothetical protein
MHQSKFGFRFVINDLIHFVVEFYQIKHWSSFISDWINMLKKVVLVLGAVLIAVAQGQFQSPPRPAGRILEPPVPVLCAQSK